MKKMLVVVFLTSVFVLFLILTGCGEQYPTVQIIGGANSTGVTIDIGKPYVYKDFDIEPIDGGKDLILHFVEGE